MASESFFHQLFGSIADSGRVLIDRQLRGLSRQPGRAVTNLCHALLSQRGEASGAALAREVLVAYQGLDESGRNAFFQHLADEFAVDAEALARAADLYRTEPGDASLNTLARAVEAPRQELFRRLNMAPGGTAALVAMRKLLLEGIAEQPAWRGIDSDLLHLFRSWFNRGFLVLERIDWRTPAVVLEKLIEYEAVHAIHGWDDLRRRLAQDRRCFAFFHPALPDEPLIFVEVALVRGLADRVQPLLDLSAEVIDPTSADTAIFYSISHCQPGLRGISFGNFLIKQVAADLQAELSNLKEFATLSPVPGFRTWLETDAPPESGAAELLRVVDSKVPDFLPEDQELASHLLPLCAAYLVRARRNGRLVDPVARFHLGNGARLERVNWAADLSASGIAGSAGIMVNYLYRLDQVERNHEDFVNKGRVVCSRRVASLVRSAPADTPVDLEDA
ncbi:MAG: malonyl-CoA decarboxylase [Pseudomonadota bacterium]